MFYYGLTWRTDMWKRCSLLEENVKFCTQGYFRANIKKKKKKCRIQEVCPLVRSPSWIPIWQPWRNIENPYHGFLMTCGTDIWYTGALWYANFNNGLIWNVWRSHGSHFEFQYSHPDERLKSLNSKCRMAQTFSTQRYFKTPNSIMQQYDVSDKRYGHHFEFQYCRRDKL